ncbi:MAG: aminotransferase class V-fold PLP-dependent enzyme [Peptoniphilus sp.]|nr:aminotransferase class V-fold PLP-dependent enzyme [Peptoniphilus sp.]MDD7363006.1 aminotransferase class V-fold PLP-dependent enzyme [Bacillota bacterium]MDY6045271.1 aminotransferase class V-fold PLP-dependent enzyme [Peptoniphilus sp.]
MIYLDNAATTMHKPPEVVDAVTHALNTLGNSGRGTGSRALEASRVEYRARKKLSELFHGAGAKQIAFALNATEALNAALIGTLDAKDHVITTVTEHNSVLRPLYRIGCDLDFLPVDERQQVVLDDLEDLVRENTKAVVVNHASNVTGNIVDIERIGAFCEDRGLLFIVDASQTAGAVPIDVEKSRIDLLAFTGHKSLLGPQGTGGLYVGEGVEVRPFKVGGSGIDSYNKSHPLAMPTRLEAGTQNGHGIAGLYGALTFIERVGIGAIRERETALLRRLMDGINDIPGLIVYGSPNPEEKTAVVSVNIAGVSSSKVGELLESRYGIITRTGAHCAPLIHEAMGTKEQGAVRFSLSYFTTEEEIDSAADALRALAKELYSE